MSFQRKVGEIRAQLPHLDSAIQRGGGKGVVVLRVKHDLHDVVGVALEDTLAGPHLLPIPKLDEHVIYRIKRKQE